MGLGKDQQLQSSSSERGIYGLAAVESGKKECNTATGTVGATD
jgi:hypothetical protein